MNLEPTAIWQKSSHSLSYAIQIFSHFQNILCFFAFKFSGVLQLDKYLQWKPFLLVPIVLSKVFKGYCLSYVNQSEQNLTGWASPLWIRLAFWS